LAASTNAQVEMGFKQRRDRQAINIAAFLIRSNNEIVQAASTAGRTTFQNGGRTSRRGLESSLDWQPDVSGDAMKDIACRIAYTFLDATFRDGYKVPDVADRTIGPGAVLPAVPRHQFYAEAAWRRGLAGPSAALEWQARSRVVADDVNSAFAAGYGVVNTRAAYRFTWGSAELTSYARLENLFDKKYVGSVIVNEANQRYYESAPTRRWMAGVSGIVRF
jgi:iron complex outermembrane receptor protein